MRAESGVSLPEPTPALKRAIERHVEKLAGTTLVGRAYDMSNPKSKDDFVAWLTKQVVGVIDEFTKEGSHGRGRHKKV